MYARLRGQKLIYINKPDFPSLAGEIAEPRPDMNIKVAAFTVGEKSINTPIIGKIPLNASLKPCCPQF